MSGIFGISGSFQTSYPSVSSQNNTLSSIVGHGKAPSDPKSAIGASISPIGSEAASYSRNAVGLNVGNPMASAKKQAAANRHASSGATMRQSEQFRQLLRDLKKTEDENKNPYAVNPNEKNDSFSELLGVMEDDDDKEKSDKPVVYNYKEVASKIQRAKTSVSAAQAVLAAKRKVMDVKRKISAGDGDPEELQLALTHAKRMEMAARKKKNHLEMEEIAGNNIKHDERVDKQEEAAESLKNSLVAAEEEKVSGLEDKIFEKRQNMIEEAADVFPQTAASSSSEYSSGAYVPEAYSKQEGSPAVSSTGQSSTDDMLSELNEMISEFGEEELKELEKTMEMLEDMEVMDPHMTREELDELKKKHRMAEQKAMVKADMDYLKGMIKHQTEKMAKVMSPGMGKTAGSSVGSSATFATVAAGAGASMASSPGIAMSAGASMASPQVSVSTGAAIDVSV